MRAIAIAIIAAGIMVSGAILTAAGAFTGGGQSSNLNAGGVIVMVVGATVAYFATLTDARPDKEASSPRSSFEVEGGQ